MHGNMNIKLYVTMYVLIGCFGCMPILLKAMCRPDIKYMKSGEHGVRTRMYMQVQARDLEPHKAKCVFTQ